jgi:CBS domain-containing protein
MKVADLMSAPVVTVPLAMPIKDVARLFVEHRISGAPVVDGVGAIQGVISAGDIVAKERGVLTRKGHTLEWLFGDDGETKRTARTAADAMSQPPITTEPRSSVAEAARLMVTRGVNRLPVAEGARLVGIVTRSDLVRAFARTDNELESEITGDVLLRTLWLQPGTLNVEVDEGRVTLAGIVDTRTDAELAAAYVARVPGVVSVDTSGITFRRDDLLRRRRSGRGASVGAGHIRDD